MDSFHFGRKLINEGGRAVAADSSHAWVQILNKLNETSFQHRRCKVGELLELCDLIKTLQQPTISLCLIRNSVKKSIDWALCRRPLSRSTTRLTRGLTKTKGKPKHGTASTCPKCGVADFFLHTFQRPASSTRPSDIGQPTSWLSIGPSSWKSLRIRRRNKTRVCFPLNPGTRRPRTCLRTI